MSDLSHDSADYTNEPHNADCPDDAFHFSYEFTATDNEAGVFQAGPASSVPAMPKQSSNVEHQRSMQREGSAMQRALSQRTLSSRGAGMASLAASLAGSLSRTLSRAVTAGAAPDPAADTDDVLPLAVAMLVCGTRGDVQPFLALGLELKRHNHRVRLATHGSFQELVEGAGLEFYPLGGDPQQLSSYMVENRGIVPGPRQLPQIRGQRRQLREVIWSCWPACSAPSPHRPDVPFTAEAIIANPVCYGHVHCAEKLQVPIHMLFTMPWTPTGAFPHPMARMMYAYKLPNGLTRLSGKAAYYASVSDAYAELAKGSGVLGPFGKRVLGWLFRAEAAAAGAVLKQLEMSNLLSYHAVDDIMSTGMADLLAAFRKEVLELPRLAYMRTNELYKVPWTYCFSPTLVPRPSDWPTDLVDIAGFFFLDDPQKGFEPPRELLEFLQRDEEKPVFIGFGSLVISHAQKLTKKIFRALAHTGQRAVIQRGWAKLGEIPGSPLPPNVHVIDSVPHDWLFPLCSGVVHHGGAGTTAAGLRAGCPTTVVPFFGDQAFWGEAVRRAGVGPKPIPIDGFSKDKLVRALKLMAKPQVKAKAMLLAALIRREKGVEAGVASFHRHLPRDYLDDVRRRRGGPPRLTGGPPQLALPPAAPAAAANLTAAASGLPTRCLPHLPGLPRRALPHIPHLPLPHVSLPSLGVPFSWWRSSSSSSSSDKAPDAGQAHTGGRDSAADTTAQGAEAAHDPVQAQSRGSPHAQDDAIGAEDDASASVPAREAGNHPAHAAGTNTTYVPAPAREAGDGPAHVAGTNNTAAPPPAAVHAVRAMESPFTAASQRRFSEDRPEREGVPAGAAQ